MIAWNTTNIDFFDDFFEVFWTYYTDFPIVDIKYQNRVKKIIAITADVNKSYLEIFSTIDCDKDTNLSKLELSPTISFDLNALEVITFNIQNFALVHYGDIEIYDYDLNCINTFQKCSYIKRFKNGLVFVLENNLCLSSYPKFELKKIGNVKDIKELYVSDNILILLRDHRLLTYRVDIDEQLNCTYHLYEINLLECREDNFFTILDKDCNCFENGYILVDDKLFKMNSS